MKQVVIFILIAFSFNTYSQEIKGKLNGSWVAINTIGYKSGSYSLKDGYLIDFENDSITLGHIFYDSKKSFSYTLSESSILLADSTKIDIDQITRYSIKLIIDNESLVTFIKLPFSKAQVFEIDTLAILDNSWLYSDSNYIQRVEFLDQEWEHQDDASFDFYTHPVYSNQYYETSSNRWRIFNHNGNTYFARTFGQDYGILYEVIDVTKDTITTKAWIRNSFRYPLLIRINSIPESSIHQIQNILTSKTWNVGYIKMDYPGADKWNNIIPKRINQAMDKEMVFSFTADSLKIFNNDSTLINCRWGLTHDGKYISLVYSSSTSYIEIYKINNNRIILKNSADFTWLTGLMNIVYSEFEMFLE